ncbi:MAG: NAD(FAD)-dependent dehydrogenase [Thermoplasmata archaeon]|nr:MAG: NAD(FAD)-dependent dehydrogenase [Thermoplasmata archaeon]
MNQDRDIVIIGCGAGGGTSAQFARKTDRKSTITVFEKSRYSQYSKCGLPYAISGIIQDPMDLIEFSENWFKKANIDLLLNTTVEKIDVENQIVIGKKDNVTVKKSYGTLVIATGAQPSIPPIQNLFRNDGLVDGVFVVRTIDDVKNILPFVQKNKSATIIGAGFIGLEMADNLYKKGMKITVVEALPRILSKTFDEDMSKVIHEEIPDDVTVFTNCLATGIEDVNGKISKIHIKNNENGDAKTINTDLLIIATGVKPEVALAREAGCKIGETGGIIVNARCETNIENIYAVGDCTEYIDFVTKKPVPVGLGSIAVRQGIAAGVNAAGGEYELPRGVLQTSTSEFFNMEVAAVGAITDYIKNTSTLSGRFNGSSLPAYFPGGKPVIVKVIVDEKTSQILGAQAVGDKAAQRINTFACAILAELDVETLRKLETAYAPSVAPTLDAVTLVCDIVSKKLKHKNR